MLEPKPEAQTRRIDRALRMANAVSRVVSRATEVSALCAEACRLAVDLGGHRAAWIAVAVADEPAPIEVVARVGASTSDPSAELSVARQAAREGRAVAAPEGDVAAAGVSSMVALPLLGARGVLVLHGASGDAFDADELEVLGTMGEDIAHGLEALRTRAELGEVVSRERAFRTLAEHTPDFIVRWDQQMRRIYVNPAFARATGSPPELLTGRPYGVGYADATYAETPASVEEIRATLSRVLSSGEPAELDVGWATDVGRRSYHIRFVPERDERGAVETVLGIGRDISALKETEQQIRALADNSPDFIARYDRDHRTLYVNRAIESLFGVSAAQLVGRRLGETSRTHDRGVEDDTAGALVRTIERVFATGVPEELDIPLRLPDRELTVDARVLPEFDGAGRVASVLTIGRDVTALERAERERAANVRFLESMDRVNRAIQSNDDFEGTVREVLDVVQSIFDCDRAWLAYPCDPATTWWRPVMERTRPEYPGTLELGADIPLDQASAEVAKLLLDAGKPVQFGPGTGHAVPASVAAYSVRSFVAMSIHPKLDRAYMFGLHQCSQARIWTPDEERLLQEIGRRLADALSTLLVVRSLRESEARLQLANRATRIGAWHWNLSTDEIHFSPEWKRQLGYEPHEVPNEYAEWERRLHPDDRVAVLAALNDYRGGRRSDYEVEFRLRHKDGGYRWIFTRGEVLRGADGAASRMMGCHIDVTARKVEQEELRRSQQAYASLVDSVDGIVWEIDVPTFCFTFVSKQAERILGYPTAQWLGDPEFWSSHLHPDDRGEALRFCTEATRDKRDHKFQYRMMTADGRAVWLNDNVTVVVEDDQPTKLRGVMVDITDAKAAEQALRWRTAVFEAQIDAGLDGVLVVDNGGATIVRNEQLGVLWSLPKEGHAGGDEVHLLPIMAQQTTVPEAFTAAAQRLIGEVDEIVRDEIELTDGRALDRYSAPVRDRSGAYYGRFWAFRDVTATKQLEEQLRQSQKMEAVGRLAGGIAHDFNNLLTVIQMQTSMLADTTMDAELRLGIEVIMESAERAATLTRQLLTFSRRQAKEARVLDLVEVVGAMTTLVRRILGEDVSLRLRLAPGLPPVHADRGMMEQVIMNLLVNARDAMPEGGGVELCLDAVDIDAPDPRVHAARRAGRFICLSVSDDGVGIATSDLPRIFEPFFTTKDPGKGTGLGLATVFGIVQQHGGWIEVTSTVGHGTIFSAYLPVADGGVVAMSPGATPGPVPGGRETVLVVEDDRSVRALAVAALRRGGYRVLEAGSGAEALESSVESPARVDLLLTDLIMPGGVSGQKVAHELRLRHAGLRVIYTSGYSDEFAGRGTRFEAGWNFLPKPYLVNTLLAIVRRRLDEA